MEVDAHNDRSKNIQNQSMSNGHGPGGGRKQKHVHHRQESVSPHRPELQSHSRENLRNNDEEATEDDVFREQTNKLLQACLQSIVSKTGVAEEIRQGSRKRYERQSELEKSRTPASGVPANGGPVQPTRVPSKKDLYQLYQIMNGQNKASLRQHQSDASLMSSDSASSGGQHGTFHRTASFSKAQRHSVVTQFENRGKKGLPRRNSEDVPQALPLDLNGSSQGSNQKAESAVSHVRASSVPVTTAYDAKGKFEHHSKEKEKKSSRWKLFRKKKDGSKKSLLMQPAPTPMQTLIPSSPESPKKTPSLIRRFSSRMKKSTKSESHSSSSSQSSQLKVTKSLDVVEVDHDEHNNVNAKSNSLPMDVKLSTKPQHHSHEKHDAINKQEKMYGSAVAVDGNQEHTSKSGKKSHESQRPDTLDLKKKKTSFTKKLKRIIFSDSSSDLEDEDMRDYKKDLRKKGFLKKKNSQLLQVSDPTPRICPHEEEIIPSRATRSVSDMDEEDMDVTVIADKLGRVAAYFLAKQRGDPIRRSQTPDSYSQEMSRRQGKETLVARSVSHTATSGTVASPSMKAYYNMTDSATKRSRTRITRNEISHRPSRSFDSPYQDVNVHDRVEKERLQKSESHAESHRERESPEAPVNRVQTDGGLPCQNIPVSRSAGSPPRPSNGSPTRHHHSTASHHSQSSRSFPRPPPAAITSTSPNLRSSRLGRFPPSQESYSTVVADSAQANHPIHRERHIDITVTAHSRGHTRTIHTHRDIIDDVVEADAVPSNMSDDGSTDVDMAMAFADDDERISLTEDKTETIVETEELDGCYPVSASPKTGQRATTTQFSMTSEEENLGAVGGTDPEEIDEDKLVKQLVQALCKAGDEIKDDLDNTQIEKRLMPVVAQLSKEKAKEVIVQVWRKLTEPDLGFGPVFQYAFFTYMAKLYEKVSAQFSATSSLFNPLLSQLMKSIGGLHELNSSLDSLEVFLATSEEPSTSGIQYRGEQQQDDESLFGPSTSRRHHHRRHQSGSSSEDEVD